MPTILEKGKACSMTEGFEGYERISGYDRVDPEAERLPVAIRPEVGEFLRGLVNAEVVAEVSNGNLPPEGEEDSLIVDLQRRLALPSPSIDLSAEDIDYLKTIRIIHEKEGVGADLPEGFSPFIELDIGFGNARSAHNRVRNSSQQHDHLIARRAGRVYHNLLERLKKR